LIEAPLNLKRSIRVMFSVADSEGKKTEEGTMMSSFEPQSESNLVAVADPPAAQTLTPETIEQTSDILTNGRIYD
jgi:hypothetical protein